MTYQPPKYFDGWKDLCIFLSQYWGAYGGWPSVFKSPYLHLSIVITALTWPIWTVAGWWSVMLGILPSILGFTIGGFAIVLALGTGDFGRALSSANKPDKDVLDSGLAKLSAAFCHFIIVQFLAILTSLLAMAFIAAPAPEFLAWLSSHATRCSFWGLCWFLGIYALTLAIATTHWIFSDMKLLVKHQKSLGKIRAAKKAAELDAS